MEPAVPTVCRTPHEYVVFEICGFEYGFETALGTASGSRTAVQLQSLRRSGHRGPANAGGLATRWLAASPRRDASTGTRRSRVSFHPRRPRADARARHAHYICTRCRPTMRFSVPRLAASDSIHSWIHFMQISHGIPMRPGRTRFELLVTISNFVHHKSAFIDIHSRVSELVPEFTHSSSFIPNSA
jgi:hypothetical protein